MGIECGQFCLSERMEIYRLRSEGPPIILFFLAQR